MATVSFHFRPSTKSGDHPGCIFIRIIHRRKVLSITTPYQLFPEEWDAEERRIILPFSDSPRMKYLLDTEDKINRDLRRLTKLIGSLEQQGDYTVTDIVRAFRQTTRGNTLREFTRKLAFDLNDAGRERTARAYTTASEGLIRFNKGNDIRLEHINSSLIHNFEKHLKEAGRSLNTISYYMRMLRAIYNKAIAEGRITPRFESPFSNVCTGVYRTRKRALTKDEICLLNDLDLTLSTDGRGFGQERTDPPLLDDSLRRSLAMFMFCFHARGMSFIDMAYLKKENVRQDTIRYFRKKTGQLLEVKITLPIRRLIDMFSKEMAGSPYLFPVITDQNKSHRTQYETALSLQNRRLKKLAKLAGIDKTVSTHVARHSWATIAKNERISLLIISEGLGHSNEKTTYTYLASFDRRLVDSASEKISRAVGRRRNNRTRNTVIMAAM